MEYKVNFGLELIDYNVDNFNFGYLEVFCLEDGVVVKKCIVVSCFVLFCKCVEDMGDVMKCSK